MLFGAFGGTGVTTHTAPQFSKSKTCPIQDMTQDSMGSCVTGLRLLSPIFIVTLECISSYKDAVMASLSQPEIPRKRGPSVEGLPLSGWPLDMSMGHLLHY